MQQCIRRPTIGQSACKSSDILTDKGDDWLTTNNFIKQFLDPYFC